MLHQTSFNEGRSPTNVNRYELRFCLRVNHILMNKKMIYAYRLGGGNGVNLLGKGINLFIKMRTSITDL